MTLIRCQGCQNRVEGKPFRAYVHWQLADGRRIGYKSRLCLTCYVARMAPLDIDRDAQNRLTCPNCGIDTEEDYDAVYINVFIPQYGMRTLEAPFCNSCAANYRLWVEAASERLEDSGEGPRGPSPRLSGDEILRSLGIEPRHAS